MEDIVKQTNQRAQYIDFKSPWKPLTVTEAYHYLGCLVYTGIQPLQALSDHWSLKSPIARCFTVRCFKQLRQALAMRDADTHPQQPEDPWWFRVEPLASSIRKACQRYWAPGACLTVDESMIPYLGHT
jgi:Transposase IS4